jgi:hypothetical protein
VHGGRVDGHHVADEAKVDLFTIDDRAASATGEQACIFAREP